MEAENFLAMAVGVPMKCIAALVRSVLPAIHGLGVLLLIYAFVSWLTGLTLTLRKKIDTGSPAF